jgi:polyisoprenoid-binding protein YceI
MRTTKLILPLIFITSASAAGVIYYEVDRDASYIMYTAHATTHDMEGKVGEFWGWMKVDTGSRAIQGTIEARAKSMTTGNSMRDNNTFKLLEADKYPTISFEITGAEGDELASATSKEDLIGKELSVKVKGRLSLHGVTNEVALPATVEVKSTSLRGTASFKLLLTDYGMEPPKFTLFEAEDDVDLDVKLVFREKEEQ